MNDLKGGGWGPLIFFFIPALIPQPNLLTDIYAYIFTSNNTLLHILCIPLTFALFTIWMMFAFKVGEYISNFTDWLEKHGWTMKQILLCSVIIIGVGLFAYYQYDLRIQAEEELERQKQIEANKSMMDQTPVSVKTLFPGYGNDSNDSNDSDDNDDSSNNDETDIDNNDSDDNLNNDDSLNNNDTDATLDAPIYDISPSVDYSDIDTTLSYPNPANDEYVHGYMRSDGTYVNGYHRQRANETTHDNYSYDGNYNPWTGETGHRH